MSDAEVLRRMQEMCEESLSPDNFWRWIKVKKELFKVRKSLIAYATTTEGQHLRDSK